MRPQNLFYIIIRPIAINKEVPDHYDPNGKRQRCVPGEELCRAVRQMRRILKYTRHEWLHQVESRDAECDAGRIDNEEHAQLVQEVARTRIGIRPIAVQYEIAQDR